MRFKLLPAPPGSLEAVADAQRALPLVPADEDDCCARLARRCDFPSRDVARTWITFLRALGLAEETPSGFKRLQREPTPEHLREAFLENVMLATETLETLVAAADRGDTGENGDPKALDADAVFARLRGDVPTYEHHKNPTEWESIWRDRTGDLLGWLALLDLVDRVPGGPGGADTGADADADTGADADADTGADADADTGADTDAAYTQTALGRRAVAERV